MNPCCSRHFTRVETTRLLFLGVLTLLIVWPMSASAQPGSMGARERLASNARSAARQNQNRLTKKQASQEEEIGSPEVVSLTTKDSVLLRCDYYPGVKSKTTVPFILLHDWGGNRKNLKAFADYLHQTYKHSIIVPDMRGHGESLSVNGSDKPLDLKRFKRNDMDSMRLDIERCKKFLMEKNNLGELNIEMLTVVSVGKMAVQAVQWSVEDWQWEPIGGVKQGKDVKAVMMISPQRKLKGLSMSQSLKTSLFTGKGSKPLAVYLTWADEDETAAREGRAITASLSKSRSQLGIPMFQSRAPYKTDLTATGLVSDPKHSIVFKDVQAFVEDTLVKNKDFMPWQNRAKK